MNRDFHRCGPLRRLCLLFLATFVTGIALTQQPAITPVDANAGLPLTNVQFPNTAVPVILLEYERLTQKRVIRDAGIQDQTLSIQTSGKMTYAEAADFIEKSFLLNGFAIIPTEIPDQVKIIAFNSDKNLSSEGLTIITNPDLLPASDQVVTFIMPLTYLESAAAAELFSKAVELHPYGRITPLENSSTLIVTESSNLIRRLIELKDTLDVSPLQTVNRSFQLERADSEDIVTALNEILGVEEGTGQSGNTQAQSPIETQAADSASASGDPASSSTGALTATPNSPQPRIQSIARANRIFVSATPRDMENIAEIIDHLDAPVENSKYIKRKLLYFPVGDLLDIAGNVLQRGSDSSGGSAQISGGSGTAGQGVDRNTLGGPGTSGGDNRSGIGGSGRSSNTGDLGNAGTDSAVPPQSLVVGKTLLVADNVQNMLIASGPPEHLELINALIDSMDVRPEQIQISAIIAQLNLGDDFELGIDLLRSFESPADGSRFNGGGSFVSRTGGSRRLFDVATLTDVANLLPAAQGFTFYGQINEYLDTYVAALGSTNRFEVLSRPTVYTINNRQAVIETGQRVAVPRSTLSSLDFGGNNNPNQIVTANIDYEDVVLRIAVLPLINADGEITLQIQQKNDSIVGSQLIGGDSIPTIATQTLGTTIMVDDGNTILLGGLISESDQKAESGLPLFANLPFVGRVFGSTKDKVNRQELLIFLQPKIIRGNRDQFAVDQDLLDRTVVGPIAEEFSTNDDNNMDLFESQDFNSAEKRIKFFGNLFKKKTPVRAVPVEE